MSSAGKENVSRDQRGTGARCPTAPTQLSRWGASWITGFRRIKLQLCPLSMPLCGRGRTKLELYPTENPFPMSWRNHSVVLKCSASPVSPPRGRSKGPAHFSSQRSRDVPFQAAEVTCRCPFPGATQTVGFVSRSGLRSRPRSPDSGWLLLFVLRQAATSAGLLVLCLLLLGGSRLLFLLFGH